MVGSKSLETISLGGYRDIHGETVCTVPTFRHPDVSAHAPESTTDVIVTDESSTWTVSVQNLMATHGVTRVLPADDRVEAGQVVELHWSPESDAITVFGAGFRPIGTPVFAFFLTADELAIEGHTVRFTMPDTPPGDGEIIVEGYAGLPVTRCEGLARCKANVWNVMSAVPARIE